MTLGAVAALKGRTTKILFFTSLALLIVSIILVPTTVAPERVSPAELVRAGSAVLSLIVSVIIIVLLSTAQEMGMGAGAPARGWMRIGVHVAR